jgi:hypothetical protein
MAAVHADAAVHVVAQDADVSHGGGPFA